MNATRLLCSTVLLVIFGSALALGQYADDYRSAATGNWSAAGTWERYSGSAWEAATTAPTSAVGAVTIQNGHTVTAAGDVTVDSVTILAGGQVVVDPGVTLTIAYNDSTLGIDVDSLGTLLVNGIIRCEGKLSGEDTGIIFADGSVYDHARNSGSVPMSTWQDGSTMRLSGVTGLSPSNTNQNFYNIEIDCPAMTANLNLGMSGNTIGGDVTVIRTGPQRYYLTAPNAYVDPITINGNIYVLGGVLSSNGSSSQASIVVHTWGNVIVTGGNFGCSRGSGTSVSWYLHGDSMVVSNATLQNSTSSPDRVQKFIFAKQGTTMLRWSNVTYGSSGTSPITLVVEGGTTLDIDTTHISNGNTGSFLLNDGATLVSSHNGPGQEGTIECLGDLGGYNTFVNISATAGTGVTSVTAHEGTHPNSYDANTTLRRYWTIDADAGITEATLMMYYHDYGFDSVSSDVRGDESKYKGLRYLGTATNWFTVAASTVDIDFDIVTAPGVTTISGDWTAGEPAPATGVGSEPAEIPETFYVDQNYPNPFNPTTAIVFGLPREEWVTVKVYNLIGQEVATLFEGQKSAGVHRLTFDARSRTSGVYIYRVQAGKADIVRRMMLVK